MTIPPLLNTYFWDVDPASVDPAKHSTFVIERLLEYGNTEAIRWMNQSFSQSHVIETLRSSRRISPRSATLWSLFYNVPRDQLRCFNPSFRKQHAALWPH